MMLAVYRSIPAVAVFLTTAVSPPAPPDHTPVLTVDTTAAGATVNPAVFGANDRFAYNGMGALDPATGRYDAGFVRQARRLGLTGIRFPGGTVANTYHWQRAIGPVSQRIPNVSGQPGGYPLDNAVGPDEYGDLLDRVGAQGNLMLNVTTSTVEEIAGFVAYMIAPQGSGPWAAERARNGHPAPYPIGFVELGNELRLPDQVYWHAGTPVDTSCTGTDPTPNLRTSCLYLHGGSTRMPAERAVRAADWRDAAARSDGTGGQELYARWAPVTPGTETVYVDGVAWPHALDPPTGRITFDTEVPPAGAEVTVRYTSGPHPGFGDYYARLKAEFPDLKVCASTDTEEAIRLFGTTQPYDCLVKHAYVLDSLITGYTSVDDYFGRVLAAIGKPLDRIAGLRAAIDRFAGARARDIDLVVTEYGISGTGPTGGEAPRFHLSLGGGIAEAVFLKELISAGVPVAQKHALTDYVYAPQPPGTLALSSDNALIAGPAPDTVVTPQGLALKILKPLAGGGLYPVAVADNPQRVLSDGTALPALNPVATRGHGGTVQLVVINQDPATEVTARIHLAGRQRLPFLWATVLGAADYLDYNTPAEPRRIDLDSRLRWADASADLRWTFPAHSVTRLTLPTLPDVIPWY